MKKLLTWMFVLLSFPALAQGVEIHETQKGIFIPLGEELPSDFWYRVYRKEGRRSFEILGDVRMPNGQAEYEQLLLKYHGNFPLLLLPVRSQRDRVWEIANNPQNNERLPIISPIIENLALGRAYADTTVVNGHKYQYRIDKVVMGEVISSRLTEQKSFMPPDVVSLPEATYYGHQLIDGNIMMQYLLLERDALAGFEVFRRDNLQGGFRKVNLHVGYRQNFDSTFVHVNDTTTHPHEVYEYKLRPYDFFGNPGTFTHTLKINNFTTHDFPLLETFSAVALDDRQVKIEWQMEYKPFIRSIKILRSMSFDEDFELIAEVGPGDSTYTDILPVSMENYYYRLRVNGPDEVGVTSSSIFVLYESDLVPAPPSQVGARTIEGGVELQWEDSQRNIFGYYVFRKYHDGIFAQISEPVLQDSSGVSHFVDTTADLRGDRYYEYAIKSISDSHVLSHFSDTISARPGIYVPIAAPKKLRGRKDDDKVYLFWNDLSTTDNHLRGYRLYRKKTFEQEFLAIHDSLLSPHTNHFTDSLIEKGYLYDYAVKAYSYLGGESDFSDTIQFSFHLPMPVAPAGVRAQKLSNGIRIIWGKALMTEPKYFNVYRYTPGNEPELRVQVASDQHYFEDNDVGRGQLYFYYITSKNEQGVEGKQSEVVSLRY